jgi:hypothetical protein
LLPVDSKPVKIRISNDLIFPEKKNQYFLLRNITIFIPSFINHLPILKLWKIKKRNLTCLPGDLAGMK